MREYSTREYNSERGIRKLNLTLGHIQFSPQPQFQLPLRSPSTPSSACTNGQSIELVRYILDLGVVDINHQGQDRHTVLHSACYHGHLKLVEYLLEWGADSTLLATGRVSKNRFWVGKIGYFRALACDTAAASWTSQIISSPRINDDRTSFQGIEGDGQSCLMWAYERGFDDILSLLKRKLRSEDSSSEGSGSGELWVLFLELALLTLPLTPPRSNREL